MSNRRSLRKPVEGEVLIKSARRCCFCYGLNGDLTEKIGQIAHLDGDRLNNAPENLAFLCLNHHDRYDGRTSQSKALTIGEAKKYRLRLWAVIRAKKHHGTGGVEPVQRSLVVNSLSIAKVPNPDTVINEKTRQGRTEKILCFHLQVRNTDPNNSVRDCRVWLTRILKQNFNSADPTEGQFAVKKLMPWAPAELSPTSRSFGDFDTFDFGSLFLRVGTFELAQAIQQRGAYEREFQGPGMRRYAFRVEAEGSLSEWEQFVDMKITSCSGGPWPYKLEIDVIPLS